MRSLRHLVLDLLAVVLIAYAAFSHASWAYGAVGLYTGFVLLLKIAAILSKLPAKRPDDAPPEGAYHALYAIGTVLLLVGQLYGLAAGWAILWVVDWYSARRGETAKTIKPPRQ